MCEKDIASIGWNGYFWITEKVGSNSLSVDALRLRRFCAFCWGVLLGKNSFPKIRTEDTAVERPLQIVEFWLSGIPIGLPTSFKRIVFAVFGLVELP